MAGRPRSRARRFACWEHRLWELLCDFSELMPHRRPSRQSEDNLDFWGETSLHLQRASIAASIVRYEVEEKAGLVAAALEKERETARGLRDDESADEGAEKAERAGGLLNESLGQPVEESVASGEDKGPEYAKGAPT